MQSAKNKIVILIICLVGLLPARLLFAQSDTTLIVPPDSTLIQIKETFFTDSLGFTVDSLSVAEDSLWAVTDSLIAPDSIKIYTAKELKKIVRDSIKAAKKKERHIRDSIRLATPRLLETSAFDDSLYYKRIMTWNSDSYFNNLKQVPLDTTFNDWYTEYPYFKGDVNATYLGITGSAALSHNYFKRAETEEAPFYSPYLTYTHTADNYPFINTKTAYTELAYWGTLFAFTDKEESSVKILHSQNITPALNVTFHYRQWGAAGLLQKEKTNNRTMAVTSNYLGKRYVANGGYIQNNIFRDENGGVVNSHDITDTILDAKAIAINLENAKNTIKRKTLFIHQTYGIPISFKNRRDTVAIPDSLTLSQSSEIIENSEQDTTKVVESLGDGTMAFIGHSGNFSTYTKMYNDNISSASQREFYHNQFYIHPTVSNDSLRVMNLDNKLFIKLQPFARDAIISHINGGVGYQILNYYTFSPNSFISNNNHFVENNMYLYAGAKGQFRKYFSWNGFGKFNFAGYQVGNLEINADATFSFYPFKEENEGIDLTARFSTSTKKPDYYSEHLYTNHYAWDNNFDRIGKTKIEGELSIPKWNMSAFFGYSIIDGNLYHDTLGVIRQSEALTNVMSAYLKKNFKLGIVRLDNQVLFQLSSREEELPLPKLSLHLRYYIEYELVKNVMTMQLGADATFYTSYYTPAYNPALGIFQVQRSEKSGGTPYVDVFANFQWKRASIFLKYTNAFHGWPTGDYFSAYHYIKPKPAFKVGIYWPFYIQ